MAELDWSEDQLLTLIREFEKRPLLWNPKDLMYRVRSAKFDAWQELGVLLNCETNVVRRKIYSILASHRREIMKVQYGAETKWFLYDYLSFLPNRSGGENLPLALLKNVRVKNEGADESGEEEEKDEDDKYSEKSEQDINKRPIEIMIKEEPKITPPKTQYFVPRRRGNLIKRRTNHQISDRRVKRRRIKKPEISEKVRDECDSFGEYIAMSLRKHDERSRSVIKQAINNILFEQEMKNFNNADNYLIMSNEENPLNVENESRDD